MINKATSTCVTARSSCGVTGSPTLRPEEEWKFEVCAPVMIIAGVIALYCQASVIMGQHFRGSCPVAPSHACCLLLVFFNQIGTVTFSCIWIVIAWSMKNRMSTDSAEPAGDQWLINPNYFVWSAAAHPHHQNPEPLPWVCIYPCPSNASLCTFWTCVLWSVGTIAIRCRFIW